MICYAIKNEEGKYLASDDTGDVFWDTIDWASYFRGSLLVSAKEQVERYRNQNYPNCKVVKVEIREVEDDGGVK